MISRQKRSLKDERAHDPVDGLNIPFHIADRQQISGGIVS